ncbi:hypothetical protein [Stackebrandtia soli]|uniref:hypothetical protein n=1 Tax=Stackebrandtia soli TaxID=1892856 RepID=UPI0039E7A63A
MSVHDPARDHHDPRHPTDPRGPASDDDGLAKPCDDVAPVRGLGVLVIESQAVIVTSIGRGEARLDFLDDGGGITRPLGVVTGVDTTEPLLFPDITAGVWAWKPEIATQLTHGTVDRYQASQPDPIDDPNLPPLDPTLWKRWPELGPLGVFSAAGRVVVVTAVGPDRARLDLLDDGGVVTRALGAVIRADTSAPLLYLDAAQPWAQEPVVAWYLARSASERFRSTRPPIAETSEAILVHDRGSRRDDHGEPDPLPLVAELCGPDTARADYRDWYLGAPHRRSLAYGEPEPIHDGVAGHSAGEVVEEGAAP